MIDPKLRQRQVSTPPKPRASPVRATNIELLDSFCHTTRGKLAEKTLQGYAGSIRDAIHYFQQDDAPEISVADWTREEVWAYFQYVETNYCASYRPAHHDQTRAVCFQRVWIGTRPALPALRETCATCPQFKKPTLRHRINALVRWFRYLVRVGVVRNNFLPDLANELREDSKSAYDGQEKRRNPSLDEVVSLVNGTVHPARRAFYAASAKWWFRPNEMLNLHRYASFGIPTPPELPEPRGFENGFNANPTLRGWHAGGDLVYLPETKGGLDKRKGNRWTVIDSELRPLLKAHFEWWDAHVRRDTHGVPTTTNLWITETGLPLEATKLYPRYFIQDAERLGLLKPEDRHNPRRTWTAHCQRHFGQKLLQLHNVPSDWNNHFRGDKFHDARGHYYKPTPHDVRAKYHEFVPRLGFTPIAQPQPKLVTRPRTMAYLERAGLLT